MSWQAIRLDLCPCCGFDVAAIYPAPDGFRVRCAVEKGGCGADSAPGQTEAEAAIRWNSNTTGACLVGGVAA